MLVRGVAHGTHRYGTGTVPTAGTAVPYGTQHQVGYSTAPTTGYLVVPHHRSECAYTSMCVYTHHLVCNTSSSCVLHHLPLHIGYTCAHTPRYTGAQPPTWHTGRGLYTRVADGDPCMHQTTRSQGVYLGVDSEGAFGGDIRCIGVIMRIVWCVIGVMMIIMCIASHITSHRIHHCTHPDMLLANQPHSGSVHTCYPVSSIPKPYLLQTTRSQVVFWGVILGGPFWGVLSDIRCIGVIMRIVCHHHHDHHHHHHVCRITSHHIGCAPPPTTPDIAVCPTPAREHRFYPRKQGILGAFQGNVHGQKWAYFGVILEWFWGCPQGGRVRCK